MKIHEEREIFTFGTRTRCTRANDISDKGKTRIGIIRPLCN